MSSYSILSSQKITLSIIQYYFKIHPTSQLYFYLQYIKIILKNLSLFSLLSSLFSLHFCSPSLYFSLFLIHPPPTQTHEHHPRPPKNHHHHDNPHHRHHINHKLTTIRIKRKRKRKRKKCHGHTHTHSQPLFLP